LLENGIFYTSSMYEFSHSQSQSRRFRDVQEKVRFTLNCCRAVGDCALTRCAIKSSVEARVLTPGVPDAIADGRRESAFKAGAAALSSTA
jgi:hypothetical protein